MSSVLVVDIGNTSTSVALARNGRITRSFHQPSKWQHGTVEAAIRKAIGPHKVDGSVLCSVVPKHNKIWLSKLDKLAGGKTILVSHKLRLGVKISYPKPSAIGADRLANACGASARYGCPVIVADFGTALTFDVVTGDNAYIGGVITPGLPFMTDYLHEKTALLPHIELKGSFGKVGKSTVEAMTIGASVGYRGMVREITHYIQTGLKMKNVRLCATGGFAGWALKGLDMPFKIDKDLTLFGLSRIFDLNAQEKKKR